MEQEPTLLVYAIRDGDILLNKLTDGFVLTGIDLGKKNGNYEMVVTLIVWITAHYHPFGINSMTVNRRQVQRDPHPGH